MMWFSLVLALNAISYCLADKEDHRAQTVLMQEYDYLRLQCHDNSLVHGKNIATKWTVDAKEPNFDGGRLYIDQFGNLHFAYVKKSDESDYVCETTTTTSTGLIDYHARDVAFKLIVKEANQIPTIPKLQFRYSNSGAQVNLLDTAILECFFHAFDTRSPHVPLIHWEFTNGTDINENGKYIISKYGHALKIIGVTDRDQQNYTCHSNNSAGSIVHHVFLNVTSPSEGKDVALNSSSRSSSSEEPSTAPTLSINDEVTGSNTETPVQRNKWIIALITSITSIVIITIATVIIVVFRIKHQQGHYYLNKVETRAGLHPENEMTNYRLGQWSINAKETSDLDYDDCGATVGDIDSLDEYGDELDTYFNEDGSFVGVYKKTNNPLLSAQPNDSINSSSSRSPL